MGHFWAPTPIRYGGVAFRRLASRLWGILIRCVIATRRGLVSLCVPRITRLGLDPRMRRPWFGERRKRALGLNSGILAPVVVVVVVRLCGPPDGGIIQGSTYDWLVSLAWALQVCTGKGPVKYSPGVLIERPLLGRPTLCVCCAKGSGGLAAI